MTSAHDERHYMLHLVMLEKKCEILDKRIEKAGNFKATILPYWYHTGNIG